MKKKTIVAELRETFYKNEKRYDDYLIGTIKFNNDNYLCRPSEDDDVYTSEEKREILERILDDVVYVNNDDDDSIEVKNDDPNFLLYHAYYLTNMYGGLSIMEKDESEEESETDEEPTTPPEPEDKPTKPLATKKKKMINKPDEETT